MDKNESVELKTSNQKELTLVYKQPMTKEGAEITAEKFARELEYKNYREMYQLFRPDVQKLKTQEEFDELMACCTEFTKELEKQTYSFRVDKVSMENDSVAYMYLTISIASLDSKFPAIKMQYIDGGWRIEAFGSVWNADIQQIRFYQKLLLANILFDNEYENRLIVNGTLSIYYHDEEKESDFYYYRNVFCPAFNDIRDTHFVKVVEGVNEMKAKYPSKMLVDYYEKEIEAVNKVISICKKIENGEEVVIKTIYLAASDVSYHQNQAYLANVALTEV